MLNLMAVIPFAGMTLLAIFLVSIGIFRLRKYLHLKAKPYTQVSGVILEIKSKLGRDGFGVSLFDFAICKFILNDREYEIESTEFIVKKIYNVGDQVPLRLYDGNPNTIVIDDKYIYGSLKLSGSALLIVAAVLFIIGILFLNFF